MPQSWVKWASFQSREPPCKRLTTEVSDYYALPVILVTLSFGKALWQLKSTGEVRGLPPVA